MSDDLAGREARQRPSEESIEAKLPSDERLEGFDAFRGTEEPRLLIERLKTMVTFERRENARLLQENHSLSERYDRLIDMMDHLRSDSMKMAARVDSLCAAARTRVPESGLEERFGRLVAQWKATRGHASKVKDLAMLPAYQQIIGLGESAIPLVLKEMKERPDHWDWALRAMTGVDPAPRESWGKLREIAAAWVAWGTSQGYLSRDD